MNKLLTYLTIILITLSSPLWASDLGEDGLHKKEWFTTTFRDIAEDIETAAEEGKRLIIIFEQRGCIYCDKLHKTVFSDPEVVEYLKKHFMIVQYNLYGDEEVLDIDGTELTEKTAARAWRIIYTPTMLFMPESIPQGQNTAQAAVAVMPGAFERWTSLHMFEWVYEKLYEKDEEFQRYHSRRLDEARAAGKL